MKYKCQPPSTAELGTWAGPFTKVGVLLVKVGGLENDAQKTRKFLVDVGFGEQKIKTKSALKWLDFNH